MTWLVSLMLAVSVSVDYLTGWASVQFYFQVGVLTAAGVLMAVVAAASNRFVADSDSGPVVVVLTEVAVEFGLQSAHHVVVFARNKVCTEPR